MSSFLALRIQLWGLLAALGSLAVAGTLAGFAASAGWVFDTAANFPVQYFLLLATLAAVFAMGRRYWTAGIFGCAALINLAITVPFYPRLNPQRASYRAILLNVHTENHRFDLVREFVLREKPDFVVFEEVNSEWIHELAGLTNNYAHSVASPREDNFGIALYSRHPLREPEVREFSDSEVPSIIAHVEIAGKSLSLIATHPLPPSSRAQFALRNRHLAALGQEARALPRLCMILGDLNTTPWSPHYRELLSTTDLRDVSRGRGLNASWPVPLLPLRIPLDHCLVSPEILVSNVRLGPDVGSDHFALIVDFNL